MKNICVTGWCGTVGQALVENLLSGSDSKVLMRVGISRGHNVGVKQLENPRKELEDHYYNPKYVGLESLGVKPNYLNDEALNSFFNVVEKHKLTILPEIILSGVKWE